jgi:hypothetical protein
MSEKCSIGLGERLAAQLFEKQFMPGLLKPVRIKEIEIEMKQKDIGNPERRSKDNSGLGIVWRLLLRSQRRPH